MLDRFIHKILRIPYTLAVYEKRRVKKPKATLVFLHGVGASGAAWDEVVKGLKDEHVDMFVVDLLGFGKSPKPEWAQYKASMQSAALAKTLLTRGVPGSVSFYPDEIKRIEDVELVLLGVSPDQLERMSPQLRHDVIEIGQAKQDPKKYLGQ
jgi:pimeloyl-ACP methyl ester carboxylesterase